MEVRDRRESDERQQKKESLKGKDLVTLNILFIKELEIMRLMKIMKNRNIQRITSKEALR